MDKRTRTLILIISVICLSLSPDVAQAQGWTKKASKAVFTLKTFTHDGHLAGSATGVFVGRQGEAISCFQPFVGAATAVVIDASGKEYPVAEMLGANATYDVAKFRVSVKKSESLTLAGSAAATGDEVFMLPYREQRQAVVAAVLRSETFADHFVYYTLGTAMPSEGTPGMPLLSAGGSLLALMQQSISSADTVSYAVSAAFADSLKVNGLSINDASLRQTRIPIALPDELQQAQLTLFVASSALDSASYVRLVDDFIRKFPSSQDGYIARAELAADGDDYAEAERYMSQAEKVGEKKDEVHHSFSRLMFRKLVYRPEPAYAPWTFERALSEAQAAYDINPQPVYRQQQAYVLIAQQRYAEAADVYKTLFSSSLRSPQLFFEAARCSEMQGDTATYVALLDSAVAQFSRPYLKEAAPYLLARAQAYLDMQRFREATQDLNDYEQLMASKVNDAFYYLRFQAEQNGRLFQQALNDITRAISMNPDEEVYFAEKASLQVRVGLYDDAVATARQCIDLSPDYSDGHLFLGLALCLKGDTDDGVKSLQRAKELGDSQAEALIEKYGK